MRGRRRAIVLVMSLASRVTEWHPHSVVYNRAVAAHGRYRLCCARSKNRSALRTDRRPCVTTPQRAGTQAKPGRSHPLMSPAPSCSSQPTFCFSLLRCRPSTPTSSDLGDTPSGVAGPIVFPLIPVSISLFVANLRDLGRQNTHDRHRQSRSLQPTPSSKRWVAARPCWRL